MNESDNLFDAINDNNFNAVSRLINEGVDVNCSFRSGDIPLPLAIEKCHTDIAIFLINNGSDVNIKNGDDKTPLYVAAQCNNISVVRTLLSRSNLNTSLYCYGKTPLYVACEEGHEDVVREFVDNYRTMFWINIRFYGDLPLHAGVRLGHVSITQILLDKTTCVNSTDKDGLTPLWIALKNKHGEIVKMLLDNYRVNINFRYEGSSPLLFMVQQHMEDEVMHLIEKGVSVRAKDIEKKTVLHHCAFEGILNLIQPFIDKGADLTAVDVNGYTAFHYAITRWDLDIIRVFIRNSVEIDGRLTNKCGWHFTPLQLAVKRGNFEVAKLLVENGADINAVDPCAHFARQRNGTLLHWACRGLTPIQSELVIRFLVENGANINAEEYDGRTPLCLLVKHHGDLEIMKYMIANGAQLNTSRGGVPLYWAFYMRYNEIAKFLIESGSDINGWIDNFDTWYNWKTPLHLARDLSVVKLLVEKGAHVNALDKDGNTALHNVCNLPIARYLLDNGADLSICNFQGTTPLHSANSVHIAELLIEKGASINIADHRGYTPLHTAKDVHIAQLLLENGADVNSVNKEGRTVIHSVAEFSEYSYESSFLIDYFVQQGVNPNALDNQGNTAIKLSQQFDVWKRLLNNGATMNLFNVETNGCNFFYSKRLNDLFTALKSNESTKNYANLKMHFPLNYKEENTKSTLLHIAVKFRRKTFVSYLINRKCDQNMLPSYVLDNRVNMNAQDVDGQTPLHIAAKENDCDLVKYLLFGGAMYNCKTSTGSTPLDLTKNERVKDLLNLVTNAFDHVNQNDFDGLSECIKKEKSIVNALDEDGCSLLHIACAKGYFDIVSLLLNNEADIMLLNNNKQTVLHLTAYLKDDTAMFTLLNNFIEVYKLFLNKSKGRTNSSKFDRKIKFISEFINLKTKDGQTALHIASKVGSLNTVIILIKYGAIYDYKDNLGKTPLDYSQDENISAVLVSVQELFEDAKNGTEEVKLKLTENGRNGVVTYVTRNKYGNNLIDFAKVHGHETLAEELNKMSLLQLPDMFIINDVTSTKKSVDLCGEDSDSDFDTFGLFD